MCPGKAEGDCPAEGEDALPVEKKALSKVYADSKTSLVTITLAYLELQVAPMFPGTFTSELFRTAALLALATSTLYAGSACLTYYDYRKLMRETEEERESPDKRLDEEIARRLKETGANGAYNPE